MQLQLLMALTLSTRLHSSTCLLGGEVRQGMHRILRKLIDNDEELDAATLQLTTGWAMVCSACRTTKCGGWHAPCQLTSGGSRFERRRQSCVSLPCASCPSAQVCAAWSMPGATMTHPQPTQEPSRCDACQEAGLHFHKHADREEDRSHCRTTTRQSHGVGLGRLPRRYLMRPLAVPVEEPAVDLAPDSSSGLTDGDSD